MPRPSLLIVYKLVLDSMAIGPAAIVLVLELHGYHIVRRYRGRPVSRHGELIAGAAVHLADRDLGHGRNPVQHHPLLSCRREGDALHVAVDHLVVQHARDLEDESGGFLDASHGLVLGKGLDDLQGAVAVQALRLQVHGCFKNPVPRIRRVDDAVCVRLLGRQGNQLGEERVCVLLGIGYGGDPLGLLLGQGIRLLYLYLIVRQLRQVPAPGHQQVQARRQVAHLCARRLSAAAHRGAGGSRVQGDGGRLLGRLLPARRGLRALLRAVRKLQRGVLPGQLVMIGILSRCLHGPGHLVQIHHHVRPCKILPEAVRPFLMGILRIDGQGTASGHEPLVIRLKRRRDARHRLCDAHTDGQGQRSQQIYPSFFHEQSPPIIRSVTASPAPDSGMGWTATVFRFYSFSSRFPSSEPFLRSSSRISFLLFLGPLTLLTIRAVTSVTNRRGIPTAGITT